MYTVNLTIVKSNYIEEEPLSLYVDKTKCTLISPIYDRKKK